MNIQKFTKKSMEAVNDLQRIADEYGNQEVEQEHLLMALLRQDDSLILKLIEKMGIATQHFTDRLDRRTAQGVGRAGLHRPVSEQGPSGGGG